MMVEEFTTGWCTRMLMLAVRIALAWTLLSLLLTGFWALLLEVGKRIGRRADSRLPTREYRPLSAELSAIYPDFGDGDRACGKALAHSEPVEAAASDVIVLIAPMRER